MTTAVASRRVFIVWSHPLFHESVRLLLRHPAVNLVGATSDPELSRGEIEQSRPDAVIWERQDDEGPGGPRMMAILEQGAAVICFSLSSNEIQIYQRQRRSLANSEELLHLILEEIASPNFGSASR